MSLRESKFKVDEEVSCVGKVMRVAGLVQYEGENALLTTRYLLAEPAGAPVILEETGSRLMLLRPFPPASQPQAAGETVTVMGEKYSLAKVRKLKLLGAAGNAPAIAPKAQLLLSGLFEGKMGALVREMAPGTPAQTFYSMKPVSPEEVLSGAQLAAVRESERQAAEQQALAQADEEETPKGGMLQKAIGWIVTILVVAGLGYACSGSDESDSSGGSARSSISVGGGK
jgi:hypothetical protein